MMMYSEQFSLFLLEVFACSIHIYDYWLGLVFEWSHFGSFRSGYEMRIIKSLIPSVFLFLLPFPIFPICMDVCNYFALALVDAWSVG